jgi:outer membrane murein-binding lipoprotein Lpp
VDRVRAPAPAYQNLAQQMQVFLSRTDMQHGRSNKFFLQPTLELLAELDQHHARQAHLQTALQDTEAQIAQLKQKLVDMAADSVGAEQEALAIAQARAHLATLLHDKLVQESK